MKILALDLGVKTGWAASNGDGVVSGTQDFSLSRDESPGMRYLRFNRWLREMYDLVRFDLIIYEQTYNIGGPAKELMSGLGTRVQEFCAEKDVEFTTVHAGTLKKFATGKGNSKKGAMREAIDKLLQENITSQMSEHAIDAFFLLKYAREKIVGSKTQGPKKDS